MPSTIKESHENDEDNLAPPTRQENAEHSIESVKVDPDNEEDKLPDERDEENRTAKRKVRYTPFLFRSDDTECEIDN